VVITSSRVTKGSSTALMINTGTSTTLGTRPASWPVLPGVEQGCDRRRGHPSSHFAGMIKVGGRQMAGRLDPQLSLVFMVAAEAA
jgi:hypothetical protein